MRRASFAIVAALVVALAAGGAQAKRAGNTVRADDFDFSPKKIHVSRGEKVKWRATEGEHTVTFKAEGFDAVITANGDATAKRKFKKTGTYRYVCRFHKDEGMKGKVVVG
jgi:plastocyanin